MVDESCRVENFHNGSELTCELKIRRFIDTLGFGSQLLGTMVSGLPDILSRSRSLRADNRFREKASALHHRARHVSSSIGTYFEIIS